MQKPTFDHPSGVYVILNTQNGRRYIGSATNLPSRFSDHHRRLELGRHKNRHLQRAWDKYGSLAFQFHVVLYCEKADALFFEQRFLNAYPKRPLLYNINPSATSRAGSKMSSEAKAQLAQRMKGNTYTLGRKLSPEHRAKISASLVGNQRTKGVKFPPEAAEKRLRAMVGYRHSTETRDKIANAHKGKTRTLESRQRQSAALTGRTLSVQQREKISESLRATWRIKKERAALRG